MPLALPPLPSLNDARGVGWGRRGRPASLAGKQRGLPPSPPARPPTRWQARRRRRRRCTSLLPDADARGKHGSGSTAPSARAAPSRRVPLPQQAAAFGQVQRQAAPPSVLPLWGRHARRHVRDRHRGRRASVVVTPREGREANALPDGHGRNGSRPASPPTPPTPAPRRPLWCTPRRSAQGTARGGLRQQHGPPGRPPPPAARPRAPTAGRGPSPPAASRGPRPSPPSWWGRPATRADGMPATTPTCRSATVPPAVGSVAPTARGQPPLAVKGGPQGGCVHLEAAAPPPSPAGPAGTPRTPPAHPPKPSRYTPGGRCPTARRWWGWRIDRHPHLGGRRSTRVGGWGGGARAAPTSTQGLPDPPPPPPPAAHGSSRWRSRLPEPPRGRR